MKYIVVFASSVIRKADSVVMEEKIVAAAYIPGAGPAQVQLKYTFCYPKFSEYI